MSQNDSSAARRSADPHLRSLDGTAAEQVTAMAWARYLGSAFGSSGAIRALRFYRDAGWISQSVYHTMVDYVRGLSIDELRDDADDLTHDTSIGSLAGTPYEPHARSLEFVAAIAGDSIERDLTTLRLSEELLDSDGRPDGGGNDVSTDGAGDDVPDEPRCKGVTNEGERCSRPAMEGSEYCHQHHENPTAHAVDADDPADELDE